MREKKDTGKIRIKQEKQRILMRQEYELLFACARQDFQEKHKLTAIELSRKQPLHWGELFATAERHGVGPLIYVNLAQNLDRNLEIPAEIIEEQRVKVFRYTLECEKRVRALVDALNYFHSRSMDVMLVKAAALNLLVYRFPWYTVSNDMDIILRSRRSDLSAGEIREIMDKMHQSGIEYDFFEHHDLNLNGALPVDFEQIWSDGVLIKFRNADIYVMSPEDMLISLCVNSCRKRYFRLKSICDIAETICHYPGIDWDALAMKAQDYDCANIVYTALFVAQLTVGAELPPALAHRLGVSRVRAGLIRSVAKYLRQHMSLSAYPFSGMSVLGRKFHPSLVLPYLTYRDYQIRRKASEIYQNWRD
jgi:hypothetical protein